MNRPYSVHGRARRGASGAPPACRLGGTRSATRASVRRSASTSASAQSRSTVVVAGRMVPETVSRLALRPRDRYVVRAQGEESAQAPPPAGGGRRVCHGAPATSAPVDHASRTGLGRTVRLPRRSGHDMGERPRSSARLGPDGASATAFRSGASWASGPGRRPERLVPPAASDGWPQGMRLVFIYRGSFLIRPDPKICTCTIFGGVA